MCTVLTVPVYVLQYKKKTDRRPISVNFQRINAITVEHTKYAVPGILTVEYDCEELKCVGYFGFSG